jgi:nucleotidyltransferase AbiEii toxin of type IV toxin-antitoxin system
MTDRALKRTPGDRSHLERLVQALSVQEGLAADRLRRWVSTIVLLGALERRDDDQHRFVLKGGVAIELRFKLRARATKDVDIIVIPDRDADIIDALEDALADPYLDFAFRLVDVHEIANTSARRMDVKMSYKHRPWATVRLEASFPEANAAEAEQVAAFSLVRLGLNGPDYVACQSLRYQIATKLHAVTERFADRENDRYRDLIDLLLLAELEPELPRVAVACREIFAARATHPWPPQLTIEPSWPEQYPALATEQGFAVTDVHEAADRVQALIDALATSRPANNA